MIFLIENDEIGVVRPVAAAIITKDPHGLDDETMLLKALVYYLSYSHHVKEPANAEERLALLEKANIITDSGSRTLLTYGLKGLDREKNSLEWEGFYKRKEPLVLTLLNLKKADFIQSCSGNNYKIYCFENPALFYSFIQKKANDSCICVNGQINLTAYKVFELLGKSSVEVLYHGDFDPEGLLIADRLVSRFENIKLFGYEKELYIKSISNNVISMIRLIN